jgi:hypothetical protein
MLALVCPAKEAEMSKQLLLFDPQLQAWIHRIWLRIDPARRRQILSILAEMARASLTAQPAGGREEETDASR